MLTTRVYADYLSFGAESSRVSACAGAFMLYTKVSQGGNAVLSVAGPGEADLAANFPDAFTEPSVTAWRRSTCLKSCTLTAVMVPQHEVGKPKRTMKEWMPVIQKHAQSLCPATGQVKDVERRI